jgi:hypothetical protein
MSQSCQDTDCSVEFLPTLGVNLYLLSSPNQHILALVILSAKTKAKMCWIGNDNHCVIKICNIQVIRKVTLSFTQYPLFQQYLQSTEILWNLSMKCWNSAFNAQGSRLIIVAVQGRAGNLYT